MTRATLVIGSAATGGVRLRTATAEDQQRLREWRNANTGSFFDQAPVTPDGQSRWFEAYLSREEDFLFMVMEANETRGCLGVRLNDGEWDIYNVIRGIRTEGSRGFMGRGLNLLVEFARARSALPVRAIVLANNPAIGWYERNGFAIVQRHAESVLMRWTEKPKVAT